jgi:PASTA domain
MRAFRSAVIGVVGLSVVGFGLVGCGSDAKDTVMPDVTGQQLDVALSDIERAGFSQDVEILGGGMFGVVDESNWQVCEQLPAAGKPISEEPRLTVDRSCGDETEPAAETEPETDPYVYAGPAYEIVATDTTGIGLEQYWAVTAPLDYSTDAYKDQFKLIITDIARQQDTAELIVQVVTDEEIALAESFSTMENFIAEHGEDYAVNEIPKKEIAGWVGSYTGGFDYNAGEKSDSADAFELVWFIAADAETEKWKPEIAG